MVTLDLSQLFQQNFNFNLWTERGYGEVNAIDKREHAMPRRDIWETPGFSKNGERSEGEDLGQRDFTGVFMGKARQG